MGNGRNLSIYDISTPAAPQKISSVTLKTLIGALHVLGNYVYAAIWDQGIQIVDISDPYNPSVQGTCDTPGLVKDVYVQGTYAYVAYNNSDYNGLRIIDISNPSAPTEVGFLEIPGTACSVSVSGNYAYVADYNEGLRIINISSPSAPFEVTHLDFSGYTQTVVISGNFAYVGDNNAGVKIINIQTPEFPVVVGTVMNYSGGKIAVSGDYLFKSGSSGYFYIYNISNPAFPVKVSEFYEKTLSSHGISISGNSAYIAASEFGVRILDLSNLASPVEINNLDSPDVSYAMDVVGNYAYVANGQDGLQIIDIANPAVPFRVGALNTLKYADCIQVKGRYAYMSTDFNKLSIVDIFNPTAPSLVGTWQASSQINGIVVSDHYAFLANSNLGLTIVDIANPTSPVKVSSLDTPGIAMDLVKSGDYIYIADNNNGLFIANVANISSPFYVGGLAASNIRSLDVSGNYAYLAEYGLGMRIIDVQNPASPVVVGSLSRYCYRVRVVGKYGFIAGGDNEIQVVDISNPTSPNVMAYSNSLLYSSGIDIGDNYLYVANLEAGLSIFDVSDFTSFIRITSPNGGEIWTIGTTKSIRWISSGVNGNVKIEYSPDDQVTWKTISTSTANSGSFNWIIPDDVSAHCHVRIADASDTISDSSDAEFSIAPVATLTLTSPNGGETWQANSDHTITWTSSGAITTVKLEISSDGGGSWLEIAGSIANNGFYAWTVPNTLSEQCLVKVTALDGGGEYDVSNTVFTISSPPTITVTKPNGGENLQTGSTQAITWTSTGNIDSINIAYSTDSGATWTPIASAIANTGSFNWTVPSTPSTNCLVRVNDVVGTAVDSSNLVFTISLPPTITVTKPNGGENWLTGSTQVITWTSTGSVGNVKIEYSTNNGSFWSIITSSMGNTGTYSWNVPNTPSTNCRVRIGETDGNPIDISDAVFTITQAQSITVTAPNGGEVWLKNSSHYITWTWTGTIAKVKIEYSTNNGSTWRLINSSTTNTGSYLWKVPNTASTTCRVRVSSTSGSPSDINNAVFRIR
jgi:hypothetical protein